MKTLLIGSGNDQYEVSVKTTLPLPFESDHRQKWHQLQEIGWDAVIKIIKSGNIETLNVNHDKKIAFIFEITRK
jgi:hypothetical protein